VSSIHNLHSSQTVKHECFLNISKQIFVSLFAKPSSLAVDTFLFLMKIEMLIGPWVYIHVYIFFHQLKGITNLLLYIWKIPSYNSFPPSPWFMRSLVWSLPVLRFCGALLELYFVCPACHWV